jgi:hypothetical protein
MNGRRLTGSSRTPAMALRLPLEVRENHRNAQVQRFTKAVRPAIWPDVQFSSGHCVGPGSNSPCFARYSSGVTQADEVGGLPTSSLCCRAEPLRRQRLSGIHLRTSRRQYPWADGEAGQQKVLPYFSERHHNLWSLMAVKANGAVAFATMLTVCRSRRSGAPGE